MISGAEVPPLYGLVLAGGRSRRMGRDKSGLEYHQGLPHARYCGGLLASACERVFLSCRADQVQDSRLGDWTRIPDAFPSWGPMGGILSALKAFPGAAFLVLACDLPFLDLETLQELASCRDPSRPATAFFNLERGKPEPLCAIYEPDMFWVGMAAASENRLCPTRLLEEADTALVHPTRMRALANANHPADYEAALAALAGAGAEGEGHA